MLISTKSPANSKPARRLGAAAVEFAILCPILCFLFVIAIDWGRVFYYSMAITNCARGGAIYGSQDPAKANDTSGIATAAKVDANNIDVSLVNVSSVTDSATAPTYVDVTVTYPFSTISNFPGVGQTTTISRTIRMKVVPLTPG
jgi:Flp pilus assembly protein TadG